MKIVITAILCALLGLEVVARQSDVKMGGRAEAIQLGGLVQAQTEAGDRGDSRFSDANARAYLRRARVSLSGRFLEEFNVRAEVELAGSLANTTGVQDAVRLRTALRRSAALHRRAHDGQRSADARPADRRATRRRGVLRTIQLLARSLQRQRHQSEQTKVIARLQTAF